MKKEKHMTAEDARVVFDKCREEGMDDNEMLGRLYVMFKADDIDLEELEALVNVLGYEFTDEFREMSPEDQKTKGWECEEEEEEN